MYLVGCDAYDAFNEVWSHDYLSWRNDVDRPFDLPYSTQLSKTTEYLSTYSVAIRIYLY